MKITCTTLLALLPAVSLAAPLPAGVPVYGAPTPAPVTLQSSTVDSSPAMVDPIPAPEVAEVPYTATPVPFVDEPYRGFSVRALYGFNGSPHSEFATDVFGIALQGTWAFTPHQALTFDVSFAGGTDHERLAALDDHHHAWMERYRFSRSRLSLMPGYEVRVPLNRARNAYFFAGAKAGLDIAMLSVTDNDRYYYDHGRYYEDFHTKATAGFAYAGTAGFSFRFSSHGYVEVGYQYFGSTAEPDVTYHSRYHHSGTRLQARSMRWHEVYLGVGMRF